VSRIGGIGVSVEPEMDSAESGTSRWSHETRLDRATAGLTDRANTSRSRDPGLLRQGIAGTMKKATLQNSVAFFVFLEPRRISAAGSC
jgi:hypothetical protein